MGLPLLEQLCQQQEHQESNKKKTITVKRIDYLSVAILLLHSIVEAPFLALLINVNAFACYIDLY
jgi:hypothetical protein